MSFCVLSLIVCYLQLLSGLLKKYKFLRIERLYNTVFGTVISGFGCQGGQTIHLTSGVDYAIYCFANSTGAPGNLNVLTWSVPTGTLGVSLNSEPQTSGDFTADDFSGDNMERVINSSLSFTANVTMDNTSISCESILGDTDTCTLLVYSKLI